MKVQEIYSFSFSSICRLRLWNWRMEYGPTGNTISYDYSRCTVQFRKQDE